MDHLLFVSFSFLIFDQNLLLGSFFSCFSVCYTHQFFVLTKTSISYDSTHTFMNIIKVNSFIENKRYLLQREILALIPLNAGTTCYVEADLRFRHLLYWNLSCIWSSSFFDRAKFSYLSLQLAVRFLLAGLLPNLIN
jgi:hypothetical protein